jgi:hypothetical protein
MGRVRQMRRFDVVLGCPKVAEIQQIIQNRHMRHMKHMKRGVKNRNLRITQ